jgi:predicted CXXCH cytochrome family protein
MPENGYRYYAPIKVGLLCLSCHGPHDSLGPEVRAILDDRYPEDKAVNYSLGELRGVLRVFIPGEAVAEGGEDPPH